MKAFLVSWLSPSVPGNGPFALGLDSITWSTFNVWRRDGAYQQIGFWDGHTFRFFFQNPLDGYNFSFFSNSKEVYLTFNNKGSYFSWFVLTSNGDINEFKMDGQDISVVNYSLCDDTQVSKSTDCLVMIWDARTRLPSQRTRVRRGGTRQRWRDAANRASVPRHATWQFPNQADVAEIGTDAAQIGPTRSVSACIDRNGRVWPKFKKKKKKKVQNAPLDLT